MSNQGSANEQWAQMARAIGYENEAAMWNQLYTVEKRPIAELSKTLGFGTATIQRRVRLNEVERKSRGGAHTPSKIYDKMFHLDQRFVRTAEVDELIVLCDASTHSIYRVRKEL